MFDRKKFLAKSFDARADFQKVEDYLNEEAQHIGDRILGIPTGTDLTNSGTSLTIPGTLSTEINQSLNPGRKIRINMEYILIEALSVTLTITGDTLAQPAGTPVYRKSDNVLVGYLSAALTAGGHSIVLASLEDFLFTDSSSLILNQGTDDEEEVFVTTTAVVLTLVRATGSVAHTAPYDLYTENGPYHLESMVVSSNDPADTLGQIYIILADNN